MSCSADKNSCEVGTKSDFLKDKISLQKCVCFVQGVFEWSEKIGTFFFSFFHFS